MQKEQFVSVRGEKRYVKYRNTNRDYPYLSLYGMKIKDLDEIEGLERINGLKYLSLANNKIANISKLQSFPNLASVEKLRLVKNKITRIQGLDSFKRLLFLDLSRNHIQRIRGLENLSRLEYLIMQNNKITQTQGVKNLHSLKVVALEQNLIKNLEGFRELKTLQFLYLDNNKLTNTAGLEHCSRLKVLSLENNRITKIEGLHHKPELYSIKISHNPIGNLIKNAETHLIKKICKIRATLAPNELQFIRKLEETFDRPFNLHHCYQIHRYLRDMGDKDMCAFTGRESHITGIFISFRTQTPDHYTIKYPMGIESCKKLKTLIIQNVRLHKPPKNLMKLSELKSLKLINCGLKQFPEFIHKLRCLEVLDLSHNCIQDIPPQISDLKDLRELDLSFNHIKGIPPSVHDLKNLKDLRIEGNPLNQFWDFLKNERLTEKEKARKRDHLLERLDQWNPGKIVEKLENNEKISQFDRSHPHLGPSLSFIFKKIEEEAINNEATLQFLEYCNRVFSVHLNGENKYKIML